MQRERERGAFFIQIFDFVIESAQQKVGKIFTKARNGFMNVTLAVHFLQFGRPLHIVGRRNEKSVRSFISR